MVQALAASMAGLTMHCNCRATTPRPTASFGFSCSMRGQGLSIRGASSGQPNEHAAYRLLVVSTGLQLRSKFANHLRTHTSHSFDVFIMLKSSDAVCRHRQVLAVLEQRSTHHSSSTEC